MKVSIIIATFGDQKWQDLAFRRAWPSAKSQNPNHLLHLHEHLGPISRVRNEAAARVPEENDWLCFLDGDDQLAPGYLDAMLRRPLEYLDAIYAHQALLIPSVQYVHPDGREERPRIPNRPLRPLVEINRAVIGTLVPRALFLEVGGFREGCEPWEDWELWLRCERAGAQLVEVPGAVYRAHVREGSAHRPTDPKEQARLADLYWRIRREHEALLRSVPPEV